MNEDVQKIDVYKHFFINFLIIFIYFCMSTLDCLFFDHFIIMLKNNKCVVLQKSHLTDMNEDVQKVDFTCVQTWKIN